MNGAYVHPVDGAVIGGCRIGRHHRQPDGPKEQTLGVHPNIEGSVQYTAGPQDFLVYGSTCRSDR